MDTNLMMTAYIRSKGYSVGIFKYFFIYPHEVGTMPYCEDVEWPEIDYGLDWITPSELTEAHSVTTLDSSDVYCMFGADQNWADSWEKVKKLNLVRHYRSQNPGCKVGFMRLADPQGDIRLISSWEKRDKPNAV